MPFLSSLLSSPDYTSQRRVHMPKRPITSLVFFLIAIDINLFAWHCSRIYLAAISFSTITTCSAAPAGAVPMAGVTCPCLLLCIWEPVQGALVSFLGTATADALASLRDRVVTKVRSLTLFWGNRVEQVPTSSADLVGMDEIHGYMKKIGGFLKDDGVRAIGIYGMGGVGKTTLLERINNKFHEIGAPGFEVVIWVTVSKDANVFKIQKSIGKRIGLTLSVEGAAGSSSQDKVEEQANDIFGVLNKRRFLLLLDDVWEKLNLKDVGIPLPTAENKCKIILTSRSREVCRKMGAKILMEVKVLNESESWKLFKEKVGTEVDVDRPPINLPAKAVARKCGGLPLALITVGRAMAEAKTVEEWKGALEQLRESPHELPGLKDEVFSLLKFSFDKLADETTKQCLLYCCLYPEDYEITIKEIIEYWVGEGFLDVAQSESIIGARSRGRGVITKLTSACLLERVSSDGGSVKMHDVVREMCMWLTGAGEIDNNYCNTIFMFAADGGRLSHVLPASKRWGYAKRISMRGRLSPLPHKVVPSCPHLETLLYRFDFRISSPYTIEQGFFEFMPVLRVLDLSHTWLKSLPDDIGCLAGLRSLNLEDTKIMTLPRGLSKLTNLSQLNLDDTWWMSDFPPEAIPRGVRSLGLYGSEYKSVLPSSPSSSSTSLISMEEDESCWDKLEELRFGVQTLFSLETLLKSDWLCQCTTALDISRDEDTTAKHLSVAFGRLNNLRDLRIRDFSESEEGVEFDSVSKFCYSLERLTLFNTHKITVVVKSRYSFGCLRTLVIYDCHGIGDLTWVRLLPCLQKLTISGGKRIEELLTAADGLEGGGGRDDESDCDCDCSSLLSLTTLSLGNLPVFKSISDQPLLFPSLEWLVISKCPQLKKLPLLPRSAKNLRRIQGEREWWERLEWCQDSSAAAAGQSDKSRFLSHFSEIRFDVSVREVSPLLGHRRRRVMRNRYRI